MDYRIEKFIKKKNKEYGAVARFCKLMEISRSQYNSYARSLKNKNFKKKQKRKTLICELILKRKHSENEIARVAKCHRTLVQFYKRKLNANKKTV